MQKFVTKKETLLTFSVTNPPRKKQLIFNKFSSFFTFLGYVINIRKYILQKNVKINSFLT
jgi:hypothetical protein